jgi:hypothetical protein
MKDSLEKILSNNDKREKKELRFFPGKKLKIFFFWWSKSMDHRMRDFFLIPLYEAVSLKKYTEREIKIIKFNFIKWRLEKFLFGNCDSNVIL